MHDCIFYDIVVMSDIDITHGPEDITVHEGGCATFQCKYTGTTSIPFWYIGGALHTIEDLPNRHHYLNRSVTVCDVQLSDNQTEYQCVFFNAFSSTGTLTVIENQIPDGKGCIMAWMHALLYMCLL